jgi:hypothetical protein
MIVKWKPASVSPQEQAHSVWCFLGTVERTKFSQQADGDKPGDKTVTKRKTKAKALAATAVAGSRGSCGIHTGEGGFGLRR